MDKGEGREGEKSPEWVRVGRVYSVERHGWAGWVRVSDGRIREPRQAGAGWMLVMYEEGNMEQERGRTR